MATRYFALVLGLMFIVVGVAGFVPALLTMPPGDHHLTVTGPGHGMLLGLFHVNVVHNLVHVMFGVFGVGAYLTFAHARLYARVVAISYAILVIFGLCPIEYVNTLWGIVPVHGNDVWLHAAIALASAYFGWATAPATATVTMPEPKL